MKDKEYKSIKTFEFDIEHINLENREQVRALISRVYNSFTDEEVEALKKRIKKLEDIIRSFAYEELELGIITCLMCGSSGDTEDLIVHYKDCIVGEIENG